MTSASDSPAASPEQPAVKPKKPVRKAPSPEVVNRRLAVTEYGIVALLLVLAFLLGSFAARNTDLWMHLATGRLLAQGGYTFGEDPFSYASTSDWINHAWLFDLLLYGLSSLAGGIDDPAAGSVLVGFKALLVTALAWVLLQIRRPGLRLWAPAFCTMLTLLAVSFYADLRPRVVSLLFLGMTLCILMRSRTVAFGASPNGGRSVTSWVLPPLFALWANFDSWFLLGPLTMGVFLLGEAFQQAFDPGRFGDDKPRPGELKQMFIVLLAGVGACLLNPHHLHGFALPPELFSGAFDLLRRADPPFVRVYSPWTGEYFLRGGPGLTVAGLAWYPLVLVGVLSFVLNQRGWRWSRFFLWIAFTLLSFKGTTLLAFAAIVMGPIAALNLQDFAARRYGLTPRTDVNSRTLSLGARVLTLLLIVVLMGAVWPGWLHGLPADTRHHHRVAWRVEVEPSLREAARQIGRWRETEHVFTFHPDAAHYLVWYSPGSRGFVDYRYPLFQDSAAEFLKARQALRGLFGKQLTEELEKHQRALNDEYPAIFHKYGINHLLVAFNDRDGSVTRDDQQGSTALRVTQWLTAHPGRWTLRHLGGRALIFAWHDPLTTQPADPTRAGQVDFNRQAFGPDPASRAPRSAPVEVPRTKTLWQRYLRGQPPLPPGGMEARRYLEQFDQLSNQWLARYLRAEQVSGWTSAVASAGAGGGCVPAAGTLANLFLIPYQVRTEDTGRGPAALPLLAVRAARRAIADNPDAPEGYEELAAAYQVLWRMLEDLWNNHPQSPPLRQMQVLWALRRVVALRPDHGQAHYLLAELHFQMKHVDLSIEHRRKHLDLMRKLGPPVGPSAEQFHKSLEGEEKGLQQMEARLQKVRGEYLVAADKKPVLEKVRLALERQLVKEAIQVLTRADPKELGPPEIEVLLQLLFTTGQVDDARHILDPQLKSDLRQQYDRHLVLFAAVLGNYKQAADLLDEAIVQVQKARQSFVGHALTALALFHRLREQRFGWIAATIIEWDTIRTSQLAFTLQGPLRHDAGMRQLAELHFLRGLLALEEGDTDTAEKHFARTLDVSHFLGGRVYENRAVAARYLELLRAARR